MKQGWTDKDGRGRPLPPGKMAYVIDPEDGTGPVYTYGASVEEVLEKVGRTAGTAQAALQREREARAAAPQPGRSTPPPAAPAGRQPLTPDQQMVRVQDLSNPAKAPAAIVELLESETGLDVQQLTRQKFAEVAVAWRRRNPDFVDHPANMRLLTENAIRAAGGLGRVTAQHLDAAYHELTANGSLVLADELHAPPTPTTSPAPGQGGSPTPSARSRQTSFATTYRSGDLSAPPSPASLPPRLKYTREQIERMSAEEMSRVVDDPDYIRAYDYWNSHPRRATA